LGGQTCSRALMCKLASAAPRPRISYVTVFLRYLKPLTGHKPLTPSSPPCSTCTFMIMLRPPMFTAKGTECYAEFLAKSAVSEPKWLYDPECMAELAEEFSTATQEGRFAELPKPMNRRFMKLLKDEHDSECASACVISARASSLWS
jgi:hypothetical protein